MFSHFDEIALIIKHYCNSVLVVNTLIVHYLS